MRANFGNVKTDHQNAIVLNLELLLSAELNKYNFSNLEINDSELDKLIRAFDWPEIVEHPTIKLNGKIIRLVPDRTYNEMLDIFRKFKNFSGIDN